MTRMLRVLVGLVGVAGVGWAQNFVVQQPNCQIFFHFTTLNQTSPTAPNPGLDNRTTGCTTWNMSLSASGFGSVTVALQSAPDNNGTPGTWVTYANSTVLSPAPHNNNPVTTATEDFVWIVGYQPWVRVKLTAVTGSGTVNGSALGWNIPSAGTSGIAPPPASNVTIVGPLGQTTMAASIPVTIASDQTPVAENLTQVRSVTAASGGVTGGLGVGGGAAVGAAPSGNPVPPGLLDSAGNVITPDYCTLKATFGFTSASGNVQLVAVSGSTTIRVCHVSFAGDTVTNVKLVTGTGSTCTSSTNETGTYTQVTAVAFDFASPLITTAAKTLCFNSSASVTGGGTVIYSQR